MVFFQVLNAVIDDLDLFLDHGHTLGKIVVFPYLTGKLVHFRFHDGLLLVQFGVHSLSRLIGRIDDTEKTKPTRDKGYNDCFAHSSRIQGGKSQAGR